MRFLSVLAALVQCSASAAAENVAAFLGIGHGPMTPHPAPALPTGLEGKRRLRHDLRHR